ncbi:hypothetical protein ABZ078_44445 [Streptomyces sp. NPDC006385]
MAEDDTCCAEHPTEPAVSVTADRLTTTAPADRTTTMEKNAHGR